MLRLNMAIPPTTSPNRMGVLGGDLAGFPNGRRLGDDVLDIVLQAAAGATPLTPAFNRSPNNTLGDDVEQQRRAVSDELPVPRHSARREQVDKVRRCVGAGR